MSYALVVNNAIQSEGALPTTARRLDTQEWVLGLPTAAVALQQACGYFAVTDVAQPADTATLTTDRSVTLVGGVPTVTWTSRNKTPAEVTATTATTNRATLLGQIAAAVSNNLTYKAIASPTNVQVTAQVRALTTQVNGLLRLAGNVLDDVT